MTDVKVNEAKEPDNVAAIEAVEFHKPSDNDVEFQEGTDEEKKLVRKIDMYLMPWVWLLYLCASPSHPLPSHNPRILTNPPSFSYMDRTNIGNAKVAGMEDALSLTDNEYSLAIILFQIAYVFAGVPSNMLLSRLRPSRYIPSIVFLWGGVVACLAAINTPAQLLAVRFLLGIAEAGYSPAVLFMISMWYRRGEQSKRFMIFWTAGILAGAFAGILAGAIASGMDGRYGIAGWRWLFLLEGVLTMGIALICPFFLLDYPATCKKFTPEQRKLAVKRLEADGFRASMNEEQERRMGRWRALGISLVTGRVWIVYAAYMTVVGSYAMSYFYPTLVSRLPLPLPSATHPQLLTAFSP